jgi:hypothetical protein
MTELSQLAEYIYIYIVITERRTYSVNLESARVIKRVKKMFNKQMVTHKIEKNRDELPDNWEGIKISK